MSKLLAHLAIRFISKQFLTVTALVGAHRYFPAVSGDRHASWPSLSILSSNTCKYVAAALLCSFDSMSCILTAFSFYRLVATIISKTDGLGWVFRSYSCLRIIVFQAHLFTWIRILNQAIRTIVCQWLSLSRGYSVMISPSNLVLMRVLFDGTPHINFYTSIKLTKICPLSAIDQ